MRRAKALRGAMDRSERVDDDLRSAAGRGQIQFNTPSVQFNKLSAVVNRLRVADAATLIRTSGASSLH